MTPSEELLAIRERCAAEWVPGEWFASRFTPMRSRVFELFHDQTDPHGPFMWVCRIATSRLQVVEMIERAAVMAMREER